MIEWLLADYGFNMWTLILCVTIIAAAIVIARIFKQTVEQCREPQTLEEYDAKIKEYERKRNALVAQKFGASIDRMMKK